MVALMAGSPPEADPHGGVQLLASVGSLIAYGAIHIPLVMGLGLIGAYAGFRSSDAPTPGAWRRG